MGVGKNGENGRGMPLLLCSGPDKCTQRRSKQLYFVGGMFVDFGGVIFWFSVDGEEKYSVHNLTS